MFGADTLSSNKSAARAPLASHPAFAWIMIVWCTLLFGLATLVVAFAFSSSAMVPIALGFAAAILGAICGWQFCKNVGARMPELSGVAAMDRSKFAREKNVTEDEPASSASILSTQELGSSSLDAPLEDYPQNFAATEELSLDGETADAFADGADKTKAYFEDPFAHDGLDGPPSSNDRHAGPALGRPQFHSDALSFGALEDRPDDANLATEELEAPDYPSEDTRPSEDALALSTFELAEDATIADVAEHATGADEHNIAITTRDKADVIALKDRDLQDLSLVQMVERFAVGLDNRRVAQANDPARPSVRPSDPRIAQAIRALPIADLGKTDGDCSTRSQAEQTEAALREALEKLQRMSDHA